MGSSCYLFIENLTLLTSSRFLQGTHLFLPSDRDKNNLMGEGPSFRYKARVSEVIHRLKAMGASLPDAQNGFLDYMDELREDYFRLFEGKPEASIGSEHPLNSFTFQRWNKVIKDEIFKEFKYVKGKSAFDTNFDLKTDRDIIFNSFDIGWFGLKADQNSTILAVLESIDDKLNTYLTLDYRELVVGGYVDANEEVCIKNHEFLKTVILTEGITDRKYIQRCLKILCPHIYDYYSFLDFNELKLAGSANSLVHTIKAFSAAGIRHPMVAVFDNDTAGMVARKQLEKLPILSNIKFITLPALDFLNKYPTRGPQGLHDMNVNGLAASIELYFVESVLRAENGDLLPVIWKGYEDSVAQYQGEIFQKSEVQRKFDEILDAIDGGTSYSIEEFSSMIKVLESICGFDLKQY